MVDNTETPVGKKRKLPPSDSANGRTMNETETPIVETAMEEISYVEFYSGVGGWTMALEQAMHNLGPLFSSIDTKDSESKPRYKLKRLAALDHSDLCVKVFSHNFEKPETKTEAAQTSNPKQRKKKERQKSYSIERMPLRQLEEWSADVWVMSPPCQPHTRQHNEKNEPRKDLEDPRSKSFLKICQWLEGETSEDDSSTKNNNRLSDAALPSLIFLENVVGFELSHSFLKWCSALESRGYRVGNFHVSPTQVGIPNDRPRFYSVALLDRLCLAGQAPEIAPTTYETILGYLDSSRVECSAEENDALSCKKNTASRIHQCVPEMGILSEDPTDGTDPEIETISTFLDCNNTSSSAKETTSAMLRVPEKVLKNQSAWCFDIVRPSDRRSSCFTHSYGRFVRGTGSILYDDDSEIDAIQLLPPEEREFQENWMEQLDANKLRYFSGKELARLFGFSDEFTFPPDTSLKQQWKLMGNSLNVRVASRLVEMGFLLRYYFCHPQNHEHWSRIGNELYSATVRVRKSSIT